MTPTWHSGSYPSYPPLGLSGGVRAVLRGIVLATILLMGVIATLAVRPVEALALGASRAWSGWITVAVCRSALWSFGLRVDTVGRPMEDPGILVANHSSWLDIFVLNAATPLYFVSKSEVAGWPGIGWLARLTGTVFVRRDRREAGRQRTELEERIVKGHRLLIFPEGTSTDGRRVLGFKPTLFAALFSEQIQGDIFVQPVSIAYHAPDGSDPRFYGWWGEMDFAPHMLQMLGASRGGRVQLTWHPPLRVSDHGDRKTLAKSAECAVRSAHPFGLPERGE